MLHEEDEYRQRQLLLILTKLDTFRSVDHFDRKLALHTASKLLELSNSPQPYGKHARTMQVRASHDGWCAQL
jgi:hypothetical protein